MYVYTYVYVCVVWSCCLEKKATKIFMRPNQISEELYPAWESLGQKDEDVGVLWSKIWTEVEMTVGQTTLSGYTRVCSAGLNSPWGEPWKGWGWEGKEEQSSYGHGVVLSCPHCWGFLNNGSVLSGYLGNHCFCSCNKLPRPQLACQLGGPYSYSMLHQS